MQKNKETNYDNFIYCTNEHVRTKYDAKLLFKIIYFRNQIKKRPKDTHTIFGKNYEKKFTYYMH